VRREDDEDGDVDDGSNGGVDGVGVAWTFRWAYGATYGGRWEQDDDSERVRESASEDE
jgi:hypothetical protein